MIPGSRGPCRPDFLGHLPPPAPKRPALTEREIARMAYRVELLKLRGYPEQHAERWADVLQERDWSRGDRRLCAECAHLRGDWTCSKGGSVVPSQLQRCETFTWSRPA